MKRTQDLINQVVLLGGKEPIEIALTTLLLSFGIYATPKLIKSIREGTLLRSLIGIVRHVPGIQSALDKKTAEVIAKFSEEFKKLVPEDEKTSFSSIPEHGKDQSEILELLGEWREFEMDKWRKGQTSGTVYHGDENFQRFLNEAYGKFSLSNPLHLDIFPYTRRMEAQVVRMTCSLFKGDENSCGTMSSGGTESILLAMKAYRDRAHLCGIKHPEILAPRTVHAAFEKAAKYFGMKLVLVKLDRKSLAVNMTEFKSQINSNTAVLVASAPNFPHGIMDPIVEMGKLASQYNIGFHVDCCLGGFILPFLDELGNETEPFDFSVPGVTSISADTHKYGFAAKGTSVIMYRDKELRKFQYSVNVDWCGGVYATPTFAGSRAGGPIAATWAAMIALGRSGYKECVKEIMKSAMEIKAGIPDIPGLYVLGNPISTVIAFASLEKNLNIFMISDAMKERNWVLSILQKPAALHIACTYLHKNRAKDFLNALRESCIEVRAKPSKYREGSAALYGAAEMIPTESIDKISIGYLDCYFNAK